MIGCPRNDDDNNAPWQRGSFGRDGKTGYVEAVSNQQNWLNSPGLCFRYSVLCFLSRLHVSFPYCYLRWAVLPDSVGL